MATMGEIAAQRAGELAQYQGRPHNEARPVGDPAAGMGLPVANDPDVGGPAEVEHVYTPLAGVSPSGALAEATLEAGGALVPPTWAGARRR